MLDIAVIAEIVLLCLILATAVIVPIIITRRATAKVRSEVSKLISHIDKNIGASIKLLEVRDYYETTTAELKKMLDEAYKEGNRPRQEAIRKMIQRLDTLKARALDKTVKVLNGDGTSASRKRRRNTRRPRRNLRQQPNTQGTQNRQNNTQNNKPS